MWICVVHRYKHASSALLLSYVGADLRETSPQPDTSTTLQDHGYGVAYDTICLFALPAFNGYSLCLPTDG